MPVLEFHLVEGQQSAEQCERLLAQSSRLYAEVLKSPLDRVRAFIQLHPPHLFATGGVPVSRGGVAAPVFHFIVLEGRPLEEQHRLLSGFTDLLVEILGVERSLVRSGCWPIAPDGWGIGGVPASVLRSAEVKARADAAATSSREKL